MKSMTCEQAYNYVLAGYFPERSDINSIVDLQDIFGHLPYSFCIALLNNDETTNNAMNLFQRIWDMTTIKGMIASVDRLHSNKISREIIVEQIKEAEYKIAALQSQIKTNTYELAKIENEIKNKSRLYNAKEWLPGGSWCDE